MAKRWIQKAHLKKGALHRDLGWPEDEPIPTWLLRKFEHAPGRLGRRVRLALNLRGLGKARHRRGSKPRHRR